MIIFQPRDLPKKFMTSTPDNELRKTLKGELGKLFKHPMALDLEKRFVLRSPNVFLKILSFKRPDNVSFNILLSIDFANSNFRELDRWRFGLTIDHGGRIYYLVSTTDKTGNLKFENIQAESRCQIEWRPAEFEEIGGALISMGREIQSPSGNGMLFFIKNHDSDFSELSMAASDNFSIIRGQICLESAAGDNIVIYYCQNEELCTLELIPKSLPSDFNPAACRLAVDGQLIPLTNPFNKFFHAEMHLSQILQIRQKLEKGSFLRLIF
jgi:hypothetical protein